MAVTKRKECNCMMCVKCEACHNEIKFKICDECSQCRTCEKCFICGTEAHKLC